MKIFLFFFFIIANSNIVVYKNGTQKLDSINNFPLIIPKNTILENEFEILDKINFLENKVNTIEQLLNNCNNKTTCKCYYKKLDINQEFKIVISQKCNKNTLLNDVNLLDFEAKTAYFSDPCLNFTFSYSDCL